MQITLNKNELAGALIALGKLVSRTSLIQTYRGIEIEGKVNMLYFRTRNLTELIEFRLFADLEDDIPAMLVEFEQFRQMVRSSKNKTLKLEIDSSEVFIDDVKLTPISGRFPQKEIVADQDLNVTELPADTLSALSLLAPITDKGVNVHKALGGINISSDGFTATNGKELSNIPAQLSMMGSVTIPFPLALLATKAFNQSGRLCTWQKNEDTHFELTLGAWTWRAKAIRENYPNWKLVVPERTATMHSVSFPDESAQQLQRYLKSVPDDLTRNNGIKLSRSSEIPGQLHLESTNGMMFSVTAKFDPNWSELSFMVRKDYLLHLLEAGHHKIELNDQYGPFIATGGTGQYIAMPIITKTRQAQTEQKIEQAAPQASNETPETTNKLNTPSTKETTTMENTNITHTVSAPVQTSAPNHEPELNPLDELMANIEAMKAKLKAMFDDSAALSRKVREVALAQRQKEREYVQTKRTIERIRTASGF